MKPGFVGYDDAGHFLHYCSCGRWGAFGYNVNRKAGDLGQWYCMEHKPDDQARTERTAVAGATREAGEGRTEAQTQTEPSQNEIDRRQGHEAKGGEARTMSSQHDRFLARLENSSQAVFAIAWYQHKQGRYVEIPALAFAPSADQHQEFVDTGDLYVWYDRRRLRFEIKHRGLDFTSQDDWPYKDVLVSNVAAVERATDVAYYISVSKDLRYAAIISMATRKHWFVTNITAKNTGNVEANYVCPLSLVKFQALQEVGKRQ